METVLWVHALATTLMTGVIWFVQVVHYPLFARVGAAGFAGYERAHQTRTSLVVGPLMLAELVTSGMILIGGLADMRLAAAGFVMVILIWASTAFVQVPLHRRLSRALNQHDVRRLVLTNWLRTILWSARAIIALMMLAHHG